MKTELKGRKYFQLVINGLVLKTSMLSGMFLSNFININFIKIKELAFSKIEIPVNQVDVEVSETENVNKEPELEVNSKNLIPDEAPVTQWSQELLLKDSRKFNLDLAPKVFV